MKIKKLIFKEHDFFPKNYEINFENNWSIPLITYLIWNNWSGKTLILKNIADIITHNNQWWWNFKAECSIYINEKERSLIQTSYNLCTYEYERRSNSSSTSNFMDYWLNSLSSDKYIKIAKLAFSRIEVNFLNENIKSVTSKNIDIEYPKDISNNLNTEIPQLLVDIKALDDSEIANRWRENPNKNFKEKPDTIWTRFDRFKKAFEKIYHKTKVFKNIENIDNSKVILFEDSEWRNIDISKFSSWEQQILYRVWYLLKNLWTMSWWIILIDEPEISLHPIRQERFRELLIDVFWDLDVQIIIATHSPYLFRKMDNTNEQAIRIDPHNQKNAKLILNFPWTNYIPSPNYISYIAYDIVNYELHIELYEQLLIKFHIWWPEALDNYLNTKLWIDLNHSFKERSWKEKKETIMTRIRNKMHHGNSANRPNFTETELKYSINEMIKILQLP